MTLFDAEAEALDNSEDVVSGFCPLEGFRVLVVLVDEGVDVSFELAGRATYAALQLFACEVASENRTGR